MIQEKYKKEVIGEMMKKFGYKNSMQVPMIKKVVLNSSFGKMSATKGSGEREKIEKMIVHDLSAIGGQTPVLISAKKSVAGFKLREGINVGAKATLRKKRMWDFIERLVFLSLPRSRDFQGINLKSIDKYGNMSIGFREHISFPEIFSEKEKTIFGLEATIVTNAKSKEEGIALFTLLGFPLQESKKEKV